MTERAPSNELGVPIYSSTSICVRSVLCLLLAQITLIAHAGDWPNWRGLNYNGTAQEENLPADLANPENLLWSADLPGSSYSSPVVVGTKVFVVSNGPEFKKLYAMCFDRDTGKELWRHVVSEGGSQNENNNMASVSPVADKDHVYFTFGTGDLVKYDHDGNEVWAINLRDFGTYAPAWAYSSSPLLYNGRLYFPTLHGQWEKQPDWLKFTDANSYLLCLDAETGEKVFRVHRPARAYAETFDNYTTIVPHTANEEPIFVVQGGNCTTGHNFDTGEELWRFEYNEENVNMWRIVVTPVIMDDMIFSSEPRGGRGFGFNPNIPEQRDVESAGWIYDERIGDVPTPVFYEGKLYVPNGIMKTLACLDPKTGELIWEGDIDKSRRIWGSPVASEGKMYVLDEAGTAFALGIGDSFEILSSIKLGGRPSRSTPAIADEKVFFRTAEKLYCFVNAE